MLFRRGGNTVADRPVPGSGAEPGRPVTRRRRRGLRTVIGAQTKVRGTLKGEGPILVHGVVQGEVSISESLTVSLHGRTDADVDARRVEISGRSSGTVRASLRVLLAPTAVFEGMITTPIMEMKPGSILRGRASIAGPVPASRKSLSH